MDGHQIIPKIPAHHDVFLSFAEKDRDRVDEIRKELEDNGYRCWDAGRDIAFPHPSWPEAIVQAIDSSRLVVFVKTRNSTSSKQVLREIGLADLKQVPTLLFPLDDSALPPAFEYFFITTQVLPVGDLPPSKKMESLVRAVGTHLDRSA
jgi:hypothetical protein